LAHAQRTLARKQKGATNRDKACLKVARIHAKIAEQRRGGLHKLTTRLIRENQTVCVESLAVKRLVRKRALAKSVSDASWGELVRQLEYRAAWYGRTLVKIDRWYLSSNRCRACGNINKALTLDERHWTRPNPQCVRHDPVINAARNILALALRVNACGQTIRRGRGMPNPAHPYEAGIPRL
jgi:putative transposase